MIGAIVILSSRAGRARSHHKSRELTQSQAHKKSSNASLRLRRMSRLIAGRSSVCTTVSQQAESRACQALARPRLFYSGPIRQKPRIDLCQIRSEVDRGGCSNLLHGCPRRLLVKKPDRVRCKIRFRRQTGQEWEEQRVRARILLPR